MSPELFAGARGSGNPELEPRVNSSESSGLVGVGGVFGVIYADPPWAYNESGGNSTNRVVSGKYSTMQIEDLCALKVPAAENSVLYLWATAPRLPEAMMLIEAWGFRYKTHAIWDKEKEGLGYWFRGRHELLMVATRGKVSPPAPELRISSVVRCTRGLHSRKPDYVRDMIAKWFPDERRLEMFTRIKVHGWEPFGNQIETDLLSNL